MSDLAAQAPQPQQGAPSLEDNLNTVLKAAPELGRSPGLAVGIASSGGDAYGRAQAIARTSFAVTDATAAHNVNDASGSGSGNAVSRGLNWLGNSLAGAIGGIAHDVVHYGGDALGDVARTINIPYNIAQHEWRYLVDVEARHGLGAAIGEGLVLAGGAALGTLAAGPWGGVAGAELATGALGQVYHKDSWQRTADPNFVDPHYHEYGSFGADIAAWAGLGTHSKAAMLSADGLNLLGSFFAGGSEALGIASDLRNVGGAAGLLGRRFGPMGVLNPDDVSLAYQQRPAFQRVVDDIVNISHQDGAEGKIVATYAPWRNFAPELVKAGQEGPDAVVDAFRTAVASHQVVFADRLPTISMLRVPFKAIREAAADMTPSSNKVFGLFNPSNWSQRLSQLPESWDIAKNAISSKKFNPTDAYDFGQQGIYRTALYGGNRQFAANVTSEWVRAHAAGDVGTMKRIYRNLVSNNMLQIMGHDPIVKDAAGNVIGMLDEQDAKAFKELLDNVTGGADTHAGVYDLDENGRNISIGHDTTDPTGFPYAVASYGNQTGEWSWIPIDEYRRWASALKGGRGILGRADDFMYNAITQPFFKRFVLLSMSYAEHIALAEIIPNALRLGFSNLIRARMAATVAKFGYRMSQDDLKPLTGMVWQALKHTDLGGHLEQLAAGEGNPEEMRRFTRLVDLAITEMHKNDSMIIPSALRSGENISAEVAPRAERAANALQKIAKQSGHWGDRFEEVKAGDWRYNESWRNAIHEKANDPLGAAPIGAERFRNSLNSGRSVDEAQSDAAAAVAAHLKSQPRSVLDQFVRSKPEFTSYPDGRPAGMDNFDEWGHTIVQGIRGTTRAPFQGEFNDWILQAIADGRTPSMGELEKVPAALRPAAVKGRVFMPGGDSGPARFANWGFHHVLNPFVNFLSREPIYLAELEKQYARYEPFIENGTWSADEALTRAETQASVRAIRQVHNLHDRTQWTVTMRNWAPFYFAQEQAYRRFGRLLAENPLAFRRYQLMISNIHTIGTILGSNNGTPYFVIPGTGFLTAPVAEALGKLGFGLKGASPVGLGWSLSSANVIFPLSQGLRPDIGPMLAVPTEEIANLFPELGAPSLKGDVNALSTAILGPASASGIWAQIIPNTPVQRLLIAAGGGKVFDERAFDSTMMQVMATLDYEHKIPAANANYLEWQTFLDRVRNYTRIMYALKGIYGAITPFSPEVVTPTYDLFTAKVQAYIKKEGSINKGITQYLHDNPDGTPFTVFQSFAPSGASLPDSVAGEKWINSHINLIHAAPSAAFYFMPQNLNNTYSASVYNEQLAQGFRVKYDPGSVGAQGSLTGYLAQLYIAAGNSVVLDKWYPAYKKQVAQMTGTQKYQFEQQFQQKIAQFALTNPVWGAWWNMDQKQTWRNQVMQQVQEVFARGEAPPSPQTDLIKNVLDKYETYKAQYTQNADAGWVTQSQSSFNTEWSSYWDQVAQEFPAVRTFINAVVQTLPTANG